MANIDEQLEKIQKNLEYAYVNKLSNEFFYGKFEKSFEALVSNTIDMVAEEMVGIVTDNAIINPMQKSEATEIARSIIRESVNVRCAVYSANRKKIESEIYKLKSDFYFMLARKSLEKEEIERKQIA